MDALPSPDSQVRMDVPLQIPFKSKCLVAAGVVALKGKLATVRAEVAEKLVEIGLDVATYLPRLLVNVLTKK